MEIVQLQTKSWFLPRQLFLLDPTLSLTNQPIYCHILSGVIAEENYNFISLANYEQNLDIYKWRFQTQSGIIQIYNIELRKMIRTEATVSVLCEKLFFDLSHIFDVLTIGQKLFLFKSVVVAARAISQRLGYFCLNEKMIGLNRKGEVKVWVNENHASNQPSFSLKTMEEQFDSIKRVFYRMCKNNNQFKLFIQSLEKQKVNTDFQEYLASYVKNKLILIPSELNVQNIIATRRQKFEGRYSQFSRRPSGFNIKFSNQSTEMTFSQKECSVNSKDSFVKSQQSNSMLKVSKFLLKVPKNKDKIKANINLHSKQRSSCLQDKSNYQVNTFEKCPGHSLTQKQQLYKSIMMESDIKSKNQNPKEPIVLQKLGRIGRLCTSTTAEQLILEQFQGIYE